MTMKVQLNVNHGIIAHIDFDYEDDEVIGSREKFRHVLAEKR